MKPRPRMFPLVVLLLALAPPALQAPPANGASALPASLDELFSRFEAYGFSGAVLVARHGEILLRKGYGLADRDSGARVSPETVFDVGSITKQLTAAAILRLEMEGKLSTGGPLGRFLPRIAQSVGGELPAAGIRPDLAAITLHQMLSHTAGIDDFHPDQFPSWKEYFEAFLKRPLLSPPGTAFSYSNPGYDLLGKVIEAACAPDSPARARRSAPRHRDAAGPRRRAHGRAARSLLEREEDRLKASSRVRRGQTNRQRW